MACPPRSQPRPRAVGWLASAALLLAAASSPAWSQAHPAPAYSLSVAGIDQTLPRDPLPFAAADRLGALDAIRFILGSRPIAVVGEPMFNSRAVNLPPAATTVDAAIRDILHQARLTYTFTGTAMEIGELARRTLTLPGRSTLPGNFEGQIDLSSLTHQVRQNLISIGARDLSVSDAAITFLADASTLERAEALAASMRAAHVVIAYDAWIGVVPREGSAPMRAPEGGRLAFRAPAEGMNVYVLPAGRADMPSLVRAVVGKATPQILATPRIGTINHAVTTYLPPKTPRFSIAPTLSGQLLTTQMEIDRATNNFASATSGTVQSVIAIAEGRPEDAIVITTHRALTNPDAAGVIILKPRALSEAELPSGRPAAPSAHQSPAPASLPAASPPRSLLPSLPQPSLPQPSLPQPLTATQTATANPALPGSQLDAVKARLGIPANGGAVPAAPLPSLPPSQTPVPALPAQEIGLAPGAAVQQAALPPEEPFVAEAGRTLRDTLRTWADRGKWTLVWSTDRDYILRAGATFHGDFVHAAAELLRAFAKARPPVKGAFYQGNSVLTVTTTQDEWTP